MFFPTSLNEDRYCYENNKLPSDLQLTNNKRIHFVKNFKYLGSIITPLLNKDAEVDARIKKSKSIMGASKHFFDNKDIDQRIKPKSTPPAPSTHYCGAARPGFSLNKTFTKS